MTRRRFLPAALSAALVAGALVLGQAATPPVAAAETAATATPGYRLVGSDGESLAFGSAADLGGVQANGVVATASTPSGDGFWTTNAQGAVVSGGAAANLGSAPARLARPVVGIAATPTGRGYWLVATDGGIFSFGDAAFFGSTGAMRLNQPIVGMAATPTGRGYWLVARDGGIFTFGDAVFRGSAGAIPGQPVVGMATSPSGAGYWLARADGSVHGYGDAAVTGSGTGTGVRVVGIAASRAARAAATGLPRRATTARPFAANSAWNTPIKAGAPLDARSAAQVAWLSSGRSPGIANLYEFGVTIWDAPAGTPRVPVRCTEPWGTCGLAGKTVPIPAGAFPTFGSDGAMVVVDRSTNLSYEFWQARRGGSSWTTSWGGALPLDGSGVGTPANSATGAAVSRLAGVVRTSEIAAGRIDHALVFSTDNACTREFRYPAAKTDGPSSRPDCIPEGARIQLDPSIDVNAIPGITKGEKAVARALQVYGAYVMDKGGAKMAFIFETPSGEADPYPAAGFEWDYYGMDRIPWSKLRVLRTWNGA